MPVREAVVNLNSSHSMENLKSLVRDMEGKKGIKLPDGDVPACKISRCGRGCMSAVFIILLFL